MEPTAVVAWFQHLDKTMVRQAGGKGASLREMVRAGIPVPPGFTAGGVGHHLRFREPR